MGHSDWAALSTERAACPCLLRFHLLLYLYSCALFLTWKRSMLFLAWLLWPAVKPNLKKYFKAFTWNANYAQWYLIIWHLTRSIQKKVLQLSGSSGLYRSWEGLSIARPQPSGCVHGNKGQRQQCHLGNRGHRKPPGRLEISSAQLLDSEETSGKLFTGWAWWDKLVGMGWGWETGHSPWYCQECFGGHKWMSPLTSLNCSLSELDISLEGNVLFSSPLIIQQGRPPCRGEAWGSRPRTQAFWFSHRFCWLPSRQWPQSFHLILPSFTSNIFFNKQICCSVSLNIQEH